MNLTKEQLIDERRIAENAYEQALSMERFQPTKENKLECRIAYGILILARKACAQEYAREKAMKIATNANGDKQYLKSLWEELGKIIN